MSELHFIAAGLLGAVCGFIGLRKLDPPPPQDAVRPLMGAWESPRGLAKIAAIGLCYILLVGGLCLVIVFGLMRLYT